MTLTRRAALLLAFLIPNVSPLRAAPILRTEEIFERHRTSVVQVRVLEKNSKTKAGVGSGFVVARDLVVTNYHVIALLLWKSTDHDSEAVLHDGKVLPMSVINVDVIHDLALLHVPGVSGSPLAVSDQMPPKGMRLYAMGNPYDLGMTIVEGTHSGILEESLYQKLHFTGSLNPGMSGGPVLNNQGEVVGVCQATSGNQISFLVPGFFVQALMRDAPTAASPQALLDLAKKQILDHQDSVAATLAAKPFERVDIGNFRLPDRPSASFRCWAKAEGRDDDPYRVTHSECSTEDDLFIHDALSTGRITFIHHGIENRGLNALQRLSLQSSAVKHETSRFLPEDDSEEFTSYSCNGSFVLAGNVDMKATFCMRAYKKIPGLYDVEWRAASVMRDPKWSTTSVVMMEGVSAANAGKFLQTFLGSYSWKTR